jgi:hypothetical protein
MLEFSNVWTPAYTPGDGQTTSAVVPRVVLTSTNVCLFLNLWRRGEYTECIE